MKMLELHSLSFLTLGILTLQSMLTVLPASVHQVIPDYGHDINGLPWYIPGQCNLCTLLVAKSQGWPFFTTLPLACHPLKYAFGGYWVGAQTAPIEIIFNFS